MQRSQRWRIVSFAALASLVSSFSFTVMPQAQAAVSVPVVINEVQCSGTTPDWIELYNTSATSKADISGLILTDSVKNVLFADHVYIFPRGTSLGPNKYLKVSRGSTGNRFKFNISCGGNSVTFGKRIGALVRVNDSVAIPPVADGFTWSRLPSALNGWGASTSTPAALNRAASSSAKTDKSAWVFDPLLVKRIDLTLPDATLTNFSGGNAGDVYMPASFAMTARSSQGSLVKSVAQTPITIRLKKGFGSYRNFGNLENPGKSSFKIKFNGATTSHRLDGLKKLTLNNMVQDYSLVSQWGSYKLFRAMGVLAPRVAYSTVYINGTYWGFYLTLEPYDDVSLSWRYPQTQHLYEALWTDRPPDIKTGRAYRAYEVDEGDNEDRSDLQALEDVLSESSMSSTQVRSVLNVKEVATVMAIENFINHWDGYTSLAEWTPNNYYFHSTSNGMFELLPWGTDQTMVGSTGDFLNANGILFKKCYDDDWCRSLYKVAIANVAAKAQELNLGAQAIAVLNVQKAGIDADAALGRGPSFDSAVSGANGITDYVSRAKDSAASFLNPRANGQIRLQAVSKLPKNAILKSSDLGAYTDVPGTFSYVPALGTKLRSGNVYVSVKFTPSDRQRYSIQTKSTLIKVAR